MAERSAPQLFGMRLAYLGLGLLILFAHLIPLETTPRRFAGPDLLVAFTFAWALRRPDYVPALSIAATLLLADLLLQRPPGLWAALGLLAAEWLKAQNARLKDGTFMSEWITVAAALLAITLVYRAVLGLLIVAPGTLFLSVMQFAMTVMVYPAAALATRLLFGVRRIAPGEYDPMGRGT